MTLLPYAPLESNRFELKIHRGVLDRIPHDFDREIIDSRMDVAIFRMPAGNQDQLALLDSIGFPWLVADTLVYYANDLKGHEPNDLRNSDLRFIVFTPGLDNAIDDLVADIFPRYANHYTSNPLLSRDLIPSYQEWARSYATDEDAGRYAWLVERHDAFIGFITCSFGDEGAEIVLNGVSPAQAGGGVYGDMVRFVQRYFKDRGCSVIKVSTQGNNHAVQKVWSREGFFLTESYFTIHVNSLLSASASK
ncbi:GNAT family N-acetyltransferase, partial [bacterium]|nr:GNAT family N-acetyltransferase [bacterium]